MLLEGRQSNRSAIGAQVRVFWNGMEQVQEVSGGSGFAAQNDRRLHFGVGKDAKVDRVEIRWPSGRVDRHERLTADTGYLLREGELIARRLKGWRRVQ